VRWYAPRRQAAKVARGRRAARRRRRGAAFRAVHRCSSRSKRVVLVFQQPAGVYDSVPVKAITRPHIVRRAVDHRHTRRAAIRPAPRRRMASASRRRVAAAPMVAPRMPVTRRNSAQYDPQAAEGARGKNTGRNGRYHVVRGGRVPRTTIFHPAYGRTPYKAGMCSRVHVSRRVRPPRPSVLPPAANPVARPVKDTATSALGEAALVVHAVYAAVFLPPGEG